MDYFDFNLIDPEQVTKHLAQGFDEGQPFNLDSFIRNFSLINARMLEGKENNHVNQFSLFKIRVNDQLDLLKQLADYMGRTLFMQNKTFQYKLDTLVKERNKAVDEAKNYRNNNEELRKQRDQQKKHIDFEQLTEINHKVIILQAFFRMKLVMKKLLKKREQIRKESMKIDPNKQLIQSFYKILKANKQSPEELFRALDVKKTGKIAVEVFIDEIIKRKLCATKQFATRLCFIIDEDISGDITIQELAKTLTAYGIPSEQQVVLSTYEGNLTYEQMALIRVYDTIRRRNIEAHELFSAIDTDNNRVLTTEEIKKFINTVINGESDGYTNNKQLLDKDLRVFINFIDIDKNQEISKGEFLMQYQKLDALVRKQYPLFKQAIVQQKREEEALPEKSQGDALKAIVQKMHTEGVNMQHLFYHLPLLADSSDIKQGMKLMKLGPLLRQLQLSFPTVSIDDLRTLLRHVKLIEGGRYDVYDIQMLITRLMDETTPLNSTVYQTLRVIVDNLKIKEVAPKLFIEKVFDIRQGYATYEKFDEALTSTFSLPRESIVDVFNSFLIDEQQSVLLLADLQLSLDSFYNDENQANGQPKITLQNVDRFVKDFDPSLPQGNRMRKLVLAVFVMDKIKERKIQLLSIFKIAQTQRNDNGGIPKEAIQRSFDKLLPLIGKDIIAEIWARETYLSKEDFMAEIGITNEGVIKATSKLELVRELDQALLTAKISPSYLFREADTDLSGTVQIKELYNVLLRLGIEIDDRTLDQIFKELDSNQNGSIEEKEFYGLFKMSRGINVPKAPNIIVPEVHRELLIPTKSNLTKVNRVNPVVNLIPEEDVQFSNELGHLFEEIESTVNLKEILGHLEIDHKLNIDLKDLSQMLKSHGISLGLLVRLYKIIDNKYLGYVSMPTLIELIESSKPSSSVNLVDYRLIGKILLMSGCPSLQDFFKKNSPEQLANSNSVLNKKTLEKEFSRIFKLTTNVSGQIYEAVKAKYGFGIEELQILHLYYYLQQNYERVYPNERPIPSFPINSTEKNPLQSQKTTQPKEVAKHQESQMKDIVRMAFIKLFGQETGAKSMKRFIEEKYKNVNLQKKDIAFEDIQKLMVEEKKLFTMAEAKNVFNCVIECSSEGRINKMMPASDFIILVEKIETQIMTREIKEITKKMEVMCGGDLVSFIASKVMFVQEGFISKHSLLQAMVQSFCGIQEGQTAAIIDSFEISFLLNIIDKRNFKIIAVDDLQEYLKVYTSSKMISNNLYFQYFAFVLDLKQPNISCSQIIKLDNTAGSKIKIPAQKQFAAALQAQFKHATKAEYLMDLFDFMTEKLSADTNIDGTMSYFYSQVDQLRDMKKEQKFKTRNNKDLTHQCIHEFSRQKPDFPLYKIMDTLPFVDQQSEVPKTTLRHHMRKIFPYADETKIQLFLTLADINGDARIEIQELFAFFQEIEGEKVTANKILFKLAQIVLSTNEQFEGFVKNHGIELKYHMEGPLTYMQLNEFLEELFKTSRFETYLIFKRILKTDAVEQKIDFKDFQIAFNEQMILAIERQDDRVDENEMIQDTMRKADSDNNIGSEFGQSTNVIKQKAKRTIRKLPNLELLKLFVKHYKDIGTISHIKQACLRLQSLTKQSPQLRSKFFTLRVCQIQDVYRELSKDDPDMIEAKPGESIYLTESEKILLSIIAMDKVDRAYECNVFNFKKFIEKLKPKSEIDFKMLFSLLKDRFDQIQDLLMTEFMSIEDVIEKIKTAALEFPEMELSINDPITLREFVNLLQNAFPPLSFKPQEVNIMAKEFEGKTIGFSRISVFLTACEVKCRSYEALTLVYNTLEQAQIVLNLIKTHLKENPYVDMNINLTPSSQEDQDLVRWAIVGSFDSKLENKISPFHSNQLLIDCMQQMNCDQVEPVDHLSQLIVMEDDQAKVHRPFMIVKIDGHYVVCDKSLPFILENNNGEEEKQHRAFTYQAKYEKIQFIEKALAVYLGGYHEIKNITKLDRALELLNYEQLERYPIPVSEAITMRDHYNDLLINYFQRSIMRHFYFQMPYKKQDDPLIGGLQSGRVYSIIGMICIKSESGAKGVPHCLAIVHNPFIEEDPRKNAEMWGKQFLQNKARNKKFIDLIVMNFGQEIYDFITDDESSVYLYDFMDIFSDMSEEKNPMLYLYYKMRVEDTKHYASFNEIVTFDVGFSEQTEITIKAPQKPKLEEGDKSINGKAVLAFLLLDLNSDTQSDYALQINQELPVRVSREKEGRKFCRSLIIPYGVAWNISLIRNFNPTQEMETIAITIMSKLEMKVETTVESIAIVKEDSMQQSQIIVISNEVSKLNSVLTSPMASNLVSPRQGTSITIPKDVSLTNEQQDVEKPKDSARFQSSAREQKPESTPRIEAEKLMSEEMEEEYEYEDDEEDAKIIGGEEHKQSKTQDKA